MTASIFSDISWHPPEQVFANWQLPKQLQDWLLDASSLTLRLKAFTPDFNVQVLHHASAALTSDECLQVQASTDAKCQVREVLLQAQQTPWVFARSIIPQASSGLLNELQQVGNKPLGQILFTHPGVSLGGFELAVFSPNSQLGRFNTELTGTQQTLFGRRRIFWVEQIPVLIAEVFLSPAPCYNLDTQPHKELK